MKKWMIGLLVLAMLVLPACAKEDPPPEDNTPDPPAVEEPDPIVEARYDDLPEGISPLTGLTYEGTHWPAMVQIENTPAARPQSGISAAELIYEIEVESQITRLLSFFHQTFPEKVGPVRSARRQQITLWSEWNYLFAYYGGSTPSGQNIYDIRDKELGIKAPDLDGMGTKGDFFRTSDRKAPHNAYLNLSSHTEDAVAPDRPRTIYFKEDAQLTGEGASTISLSYTSNNKISYDYDEATGTYKRFINGAAMIDKENGEQVTVTNIIVQRARHFKVTGTVYTNIDLFGSGEAIYFSQGKMQVGTWERKDKNDLTVYYDANGEEIPLPPGKTFVQIVREDTAITTE
ncbi:DUF3048 domain-containing protein [Alkalibacter rhizosphaerae]|uniref:DUF3048 domain-containing protein n=1 Tax=Alkalibacter rhizosphaerae TaxID=2815577 RepID=A0A974XFQ3_9FIRM|nr:DUF3048 domain-containing protein [Alkalibacter rhizosphaerae]QSX07790.1 DUF3048 domain-containing protein [Alkalibacter rhizosphaerae]